MPFLAIIFDAIAFAAYVFQLQHQTPTIFILGALLQMFVVIFLSTFTFGYRGPRHEKRDYTFKGYRYFSIRFAIILFSLIINTIVFVLYIMNILGTNTMMFN